MAKKLKRAFTITELVIVIAVIAILAAVLIPTFSNIVRRANESADIQAVREMNVALANEEALAGEKPANIGEVREILAEAGYNSDGYHPISSGYAFYWKQSVNCIILVKGEGSAREVVYPEDYAGAGEDFLYNDTDCYNLETGWSAEYDSVLGEISASGNNSLAIGGGEATAEEAKERLVTVLNMSAFGGETFEGVTLTLGQDIDLENETLTPFKEFCGTLDGNGKTISGVNITPRHGADGNGYLYSDDFDVEEGIQKSKYGVGLIACLNGGTVKNLSVTYSDADGTHADPLNEYTYFGGIAGCLFSGTIENCTVSGDIVQYNRVGGIAGTALHGTIRNCTVTANITSKTTSKGYHESNVLPNYSYAGGIVAYVGNHIDGAQESVTISDCTVGAADPENAVTIKAHYAVGGFVGWDALGTDITISGGTLRNAAIVSTGGNSYAGLLIGRTAASNPNSVTAYAEKITFSSGIQLTNAKIEGYSSGETAAMYALTGEQNVYIGNLSKNSGSENDDVLFNGAPFTQPSGQNYQDKAILIGNAALGGGEGRFANLTIAANAAFSVSGCSASKAA